MVTLKHDSHDHELDLTEVDAYMVGKGKCGVCRMPIAEASSIYKCLKQDCPNDSLSIFFFLHKTCAELPKQIKHAHHPQHSLILARGFNHEVWQLLKGAYPQLRACRLCFRNINEQMWVYMCEVCCQTYTSPFKPYTSRVWYEFGLCISCAKMEPVLYHQGHPNHTLTLLRRPISVICSACGIWETSEVCYTCLPCQFWIHSSCAASPPTIRLRVHQDDTLHLIYSIPDKYRGFSKHCQICKDEVRTDKWAYFCEDSGSGEETIKFEEVEEDHAQTHPNLLQFPLSSTDCLITNLIGKPFNQTNLTTEPLIKHWSHDHPLILNNEVKFKDDDSDDDDDYDERYFYNEILQCNACTTSISNEHKYYACILCNYFLHTFCAKYLPHEFPAGKCEQDPNHSLNLSYSSFLGPISVTYCQSCRYATNGFRYTCNTCSEITDLLCCLSPEKIKHDFHKHALVKHLNSDVYAFNIACSLCSDAILFGYYYRCQTCSNVQIHQHCAMLYSKTIRHRFDSHSITLIYPPIYYKGLKYCEICEMQVNPEAFLYLCRQCDQCFHPKCTRPSQIVKLRGKVLVGGVHAHELTLVAIDKDVYPQRIHKALTCSQGHESEPVGMFLQCARCNYLLCRICLIALWKAILKELENED
nr:PREDICTED: uncharacterized protein LOC108212911 [Daucus carota subsp. sativus]